MKFFNIDYIEQPAKVLGLVEFSTKPEALGAPARDDGIRATVGSAKELGALPSEVLVELWVLKAPEAVGLPAGVSPGQAIWDVLVPPAPKTPAKPASVKPGKKDKKKVEGGLPAGPDASTSSAPDGALPTDAGKDKTMAKKAKKATKKAAKKSANGSKAKGLPREGTKAAKLLALISKPGGATFAEMHKATGWKEMRGTAHDLAIRAGKKLTMIEEEGKASRWAAK